MESVSKTKPNWLLRSLIGVSLGIHLVIFLHIADLYRSPVLTYIELTLKDVSKPPTRSIPRPRQRSKVPDRIREIKRLKVTQRPIPRFKPIRIEPAERDLPDSLVERISIPKTRNHPRLNIAEWSPVKLEENSGEYATSRHYLEIVKLRIEAHKKYPASARINQIEGRTTVRFVIVPDGQVTVLKVIKSSRTKALDRAAISAIKEASPFPRPPAHLFKGPIPLELTIVFELT